MHKTALRLGLGLAIVGVLVLSARAADEKKEEKKEVTLKGTLTCSKCDLGETKACGTVIKVKEGGKDVVYYFKDEGKKEKYHGEICTGAKAGSVTGVVTEDEKEKKKFITPSKDGVKIDK